MNKRYIAALVALALPCTAAYADTVELSSGSTQINILKDTVHADTLSYSPLCENGRTFIEKGDAEKAFGITITEATDYITAVSGDKQTRIPAAETRRTDGVLYLPLRSMMEALGKTVGYCYSLNTVTVSDSPVIMDIGGNKITADEFDLYYNMDSYVSDDEIEAAKKLIRDNLKEMNAVYYTAIESGFGSILDSGNIKQSIAEYSNNFAASGGIAVLKSSVATASEKNYVANNYIQAAITSITVDDSEIEAAYKTDYITAKHILIPTVATATGAELSDKEKTEAKKLAEDILKKLKNGGDFDALMKEYSKDPGLAANPNGYTFAKGDMVEEFEAAAYALKENEISDIVTTSYGYHIIKRVVPLPLDDSLKSTVEHRIKNKKLQEYISDIMEKSNITVYGE